MDIDSSKEQTLGKFCQKLWDAGCEQKSTEPYSPWHNAIEHKIKELEKGAGTKLLLTNTPHQLWADCLEYEACQITHSTQQIQTRHGGNQNHHAWCDCWHKYGLPQPKLVDDALAIDQCTGSTLWADAIAKEKKNVCIAFDALEDSRNIQHGFWFVECHMIFDIKMEDFHWKAHLLASRQMANVPATLTYASATVCVALMLAAWNLLDVIAADIMNAYTTAPCK